LKSQWKSTCIFGTVAALLVHSNFVPPPKTRALPDKDGAVTAVVQVNGRGSTL
jgi:hypothetical protein